MPTSCAAEFLRFSQISFATAQGLLSALLFAQIQRESNTLASTLFEQRAGDEHRHAAAIFPEILRLVWPNHPSCLQFRQCAFVALTPLGGCQIGPAHAV